MLSIVKDLFTYIDRNKAKYLKDLEEAVAIPSVSAFAKNRDDVFRMIDWTHSRLRQVKVDVLLRDLGFQQLPDGRKIPLPPVILGTLGNDPQKKTICVYAHLDVQPAEESGWNSDPFVLTELDGKLYGRGASDDKAAVLCWLHAIGALQALGQEIPVNIKFIFEGMEECGSEGLDGLLNSEKDKFLANIDYVCICDGGWFNINKPCMVYGLRGMCYFFVQVKCANKDLHSGGSGGTIYEGLADLIYLLDSLVDKDGKLLVKDFNEDVAPLLPDELGLYEKTSFDIAEFRTVAGVKRCAHNEEKVPLLMHRWRYPSLSIHGIEGAFNGPGQKTVIPGTVTGKFSIRIVSNQEPSKIEKCVVDYLEEKWSERDSPNTMQVLMTHGIKPWSEDPSNPQYEAAERAIRQVYNVEPDLVREGGTIPIIITLKEITGKNVIVLPIGGSDDNIHAQNEKINITNYIQGIKLFGAFMYEISQL